MEYERAMPEPSERVLSDRTPAASAACYACGRKMYKTDLSPGEPTEWRHASSGHAVSWSPDKHLAGLSKVTTHLHRWNERSGGVQQCVAESCDSELLMPVRKLEDIASGQAKGTRTKPKPITIRSGKKR